MPQSYNTGIVARQDHDGAYATYGIHNILVP